MRRIAISEPAFLGNERAYVSDCMDRRRLSGAEYMRRFEAAVAERSGTRFAVATSNGTCALHAALLALGLRGGDEVIVPATTYIATINAVTYCGAVPVIVDVRPDTWGIDWAAVSRAVTSRTVGVIPVHLYGVPSSRRADNGPHFWVLEDAAEAHGATAGGDPVGSLGAAGVFSYYGNKILTCGEGGAVVTDRADVAARVRQLRGQGVSPTRRYVHSTVGYNYRMTELQAAIGLAQAETLDEHLRRRSTLGDRYRERIPEHMRQAHPDGSVDWVFPVLLRDRDAVADALAEEQVETRPVFPPLNTQPPYLSSAQFPVAERLGRDGLLLPLHGWMGLDDVDRICDVTLAVDAKSDREEVAHG